MKQISNTTKLLLLSICLLIVYALAIIIVDPLFHYHRPLKGFLYSTSIDSRHICDGIIKHFDYDTITTGDSLSVNYKVSEINDLFDVHSIKASHYYADYSELYELVECAVKYNKNFKNLFWTLNPNNLMIDKDQKRHGEWPEYLYNQNPFDDVNYVFNKDVMWNGIVNSLSQAKKNTSISPFDFDTFLSYESPRGKSIVLAGRTYRDAAPKATFSPEEKHLVCENIEDNILQLAKNHPQIDFTIIIPPLSIIWWDDLYRTGEIEKYIAAEETAIQCLLTCDNIRVYSFVNEYSTVCDYDRYCDTIHYGKEVSSMMLQSISKGSNEITKENYSQYCQDVRNFYLNYEYDEIYKN